MFYTCINVCVWYKIKFLRRRFALRNQNFQWYHNLLDNFIPNKMSASRNQIKCRYGIWNSCKFIRGWITFNPPPWVLWPSITKFNVFSFTALHLDLFRQFDPIQGHFGPWSRSAIKENHCLEMVNIFYDDDDLNAAKMVQLSSNSKHSFKTHTLLKKLFHFLKFSEILPIICFQIFALQRLTNEKMKSIQFKPKISKILRVSGQICQLFFLGNKTLMPGLVYI